MIFESTAHQLLGRRVLGDAPAVGVAVLVLFIDEIADQDVALRLQAADDRVEALVPVFSVIAFLFELPRENGRCALNQVEKHFVAERG